MTLSTSASKRVVPEAPIGLQRGDFNRARHAASVPVSQGDGQSSRLGDGRSVSRRKDRSVWLVSARRYATAAVLCALFSTVYESLSHGVLSLWMIALFAYPLALGMVPALVAHIVRIGDEPLARELWACGVTTFAMGSCLRGVLEIYGTTSTLVAPYPSVGLGLLALGALVQATHGWPIAS